ncbi:MAG: 50S ribosomal protein L23 [Candidatus Omnitrophota bacterium]
MQSPYKIVKYILRTEKGTVQEKENKYIFSVDKKANKIEIKHAIEFIYRVKVNTIHTLTMPGKPKRVRYKMGKTSSWKKAVVTLAPGQKINIT